MKLLIKGFLTLAVFVAVLGTFPVFAEAKVPERPINSAVYDPKGYVDDHTEDEINKLNQDREEQVAVVVLDTLDGTTIEEFANKTARAWQIGYSDTNTGALVVISVRDRKSRIETSNNFAVYVPDNETRLLLEDAKQLLRSEDYSGAVFDIAQGLHTSYQNGKQSESDAGEVSSDEVDSVSVILSMLTAATTVLGAAIAMTVFIYKKVNQGGLEIRTERRSEFFEDRRASSTSGLKNQQTQREINDLINASTATGIVASQLNTKKRSTSSLGSSYRKRDDDYMPSSSWSPSDWGGGGFDGGGSSSDW